MSSTITDGQLTTQDLSEVRVYILDYDANNLASGVELAAVGTFTITPSGLTSDNAGLMRAGTERRACGSWRHGGRDVTESSTRLPRMSRPRRPKANGFGCRSPDVLGSAETLHHDTLPESHDGRSLRDLPHDA